MRVLRDARRRPVAFALAGAVNGAVAAAACILLPLGEIEPLAVGAYCLGVLPIVGAHCGGVDGALYLFPGLVFGPAFGVLLRCRGRLGVGGAAVYAAAAVFANAAAVLVCVSLLHPIDDLLPFDNLVIDMALGGVAAGGAGAGLLGAVLRRLDPAARLAPPIIAGAALGMLVALMLVLPDTIGVYAFYILWQAGYAAAGAFAYPAS